YLQAVEGEDAAWGIYFLTGRRFKRFISSRKIWEWAKGCLQMPEWLLDECLASVGDTGEAIGLLFPPGTKRSSLTLTQWTDERILTLAKMEEDQQKEKIIKWWKECGSLERFLVNKILTGELRVGVSTQLTLKALEELTGTSPLIL